MASDDLSTPLGTRKARRLKLPRLPFDGWRVAGMAVAAVLLALAGYVGLSHAPLGGEPLVVADIERMPAPAAPPESARPATRPLAAAGKTEPGAGPLIIKVPDGSGAAPANGALEPVMPALLEQTRHGTLPKIAPDGRRPADVYARPAPPASDTRPRVAVFLSALGTGAAVTGDAIEKLPPEITLGFTPYARDLERWAEKARKDGHEIVLQIPMEPFDFPNNDPGPQALLTSLPASANSERLLWTMGRIAGYIGISNYMGARFLGEEEPLAPVLTEAARRGLMFIDDGTAQRGVSPVLARKTGLTLARSDGVIDLTPQPAEIDAALQRLEDKARKDGYALGTATALPVTVERLARWAKTLESRGLLLVPVSAITRRSNAS